MKKKTFSIVCKVAHYILKNWRVSYYWLKVGFSTKICLIKIILNGLTKMFEKLDELNTHITDDSLD